MALSGSDPEGPRAVRHRRPAAPAPGPAACLLWHAAASPDDLADGFTAGLVKALADEGAVELAGVVVSGRPALRGAWQFAAVLGALGVRNQSGSVMVGVGADTAGEMLSARAGAPRFPVSPPGDGRRLALDVLAGADDAS